MEWFSVKWSEITDFTESRNATSAVEMQGLHGTSGWLVSLRLLLLPCPQKGTNAGWSGDPRGLRVLTLPETVENGVMTSEFYFWAQDLMASQTPKACYCFPHSTAEKRNKTKRTQTLNQVPVTCFATCIFISIENAFCLVIFNCSSHTFQGPC